MASSDVLLAVTVGAIAATAAIMIVFYLLRNLRSRRVKALSGGAARPEFADDRAFNRIALARREADLLASRGGQVDRARELIGLAESSLRSREFDRAYELAQSAHESLVTARRRDGGGGLAAAPARLPPLRTASIEELQRPAAGPPPAGTEAPPPAAPAVPKNRAEAQFQLRLFEQDLVAARAKDGGSQPSAEARDLYVAAQGAFARGDYAEAFRLALRGRRRVGGTVESLGGAPSPPPAAASRDVTAVAEQVAQAERCPSCGHPTSPEDTFCRGCGAARTAPACPQCGASRRPEDAFCGKCGARYA